MTTTIAYLEESTASGWQRTLYAFLAEKQRRSGSDRTVQSYSRMLQHFFGRFGKAPDQVTSQDLFAWAYGTGLSGREPGSITIGARLACLSSFYRFLIRMKVVAANPCNAIERPRMPESTPRGLSAEGIRRLLDTLPETPVGVWDRAIILTRTFTGRRRAEVLGMAAGSISVEGGCVYYRYRGKGSKMGNIGLSRWTRSRGPWQLVYREESTTRSEAMRRERDLKSASKNQELRAKIAQSVERRSGRINR